MQPLARQAEVGAADLGNDQVGIGCPYIGEYLIGSGTIGPYIRVIYTDPDTAYAEGTGRIPPKGGLQSDGGATAEGTGQRLGLPPYLGCNGRGGVTGGGDLRLLPPEHRIAIYCE